MDPAFFDMKGLLLYLLPLYENFLPTSSATLSLERLQKEMAVNFWNKKLKCGINYRKTSVQIAPSNDILHLYIT